MSVIAPIAPPQLEAVPSNHCCWYPKRRPARAKEILLGCLLAPVLSVLSFVLVSLSFEAPLVSMGARWGLASGVGLALGLLAGALTLVLTLRELIASANSQVVLGEQAVIVPGEITSPLYYCNIKSLTLNHNALVLDMRYQHAVELRAGVWPIEEIAMTLGPRLE